MRNLKLLILIASVAMTVSCAKEKKANTDSVPTVVVPVGPYVPPTTGPGQNPGSIYGGSAALTIPSLAVFSEYTGRPMNNPQDIKINLNMIKSSSSSTFGGTATITYTDNGIAYQGYFTAGSSSAATKYNVTFNYAGNNVWHAVFEDFMGGLVVVIDQIVDLGDGGPVDLASGSVWFKNFGLTYAPHPPTYCWFVSLGPYDCRPWPDGKGMNTYQSPYPQAGYVQLGTFSGMSISKAFNNQSLY